MRSSREEARCCRGHEKLSKSGAARRSTRAALAAVPGRLSATIAPPKADDLTRDVGQQVPPLSWRRRSHRALALRPPPGPRVTLACIRFSQQPCITAFAAALNAFPC